MQSYPYEEVKKTSTAYFNGDELVASTWINKYALKDKDGAFYDLTPHDMHDRLAKEFARIDKEVYHDNFDWLPHYRLAFDSFARIVPQGSPMTAVGNPFHTMSASNCVVVGSPHDSIGGIMSAATELAQLYKRRCGVGLDISELRPDGMTVNNAARTTSGAWSFSDLYSYITRKVCQDGRRGALMITLDVHHPDVVKFALMKQDLTKVTGANVSIKASDEFMKAVEEDGMYEQRWPLTGSPIVSKMVRARDVWNVIIECATKTAEPCIVFWDRILKYSPTYAYPWARSISMNPCQPGWAPLLTPNGISKLSDVNIGDTIWSGTKWTKVLNKWSTGIKPVFRYRTNAGVFYGTENHNIIQNGARAEVGTATSIDIAKANIELSSDFDMTDVLDGLIIGDGTHHKASNAIYINVGQDDIEDYRESILPFISRTTGENRGRNEWWVKSTSVHNYEMDILPNRKIPDSFFHGSFKKMRGFLRGLYSANGSVLEKYGRITLKATSSMLVEQVQQMLSSLGIYSYITRNKASVVEFRNGIYECRPSFDINITTDRNRFRDIIGFIHAYKNNSLNKICERAKLPPKKTSYEIISCDYVRDEEVFDITVEDAAHTYWTGGHLVSNCAEISLCAYDSCRLISLNLTGYVRNAFKKDAFFDTEAFADDVVMATRLSDNLVDLEVQLIDKILSRCEDDIERDLWIKLQATGKKYRRVGIGMHALADTFAQLCIRYDSNDALAMADTIASTLRNVAYDTSVTLAETRGAFDGFDWEAEKDNEFIKDIPEPIRQRMAKHGRRNIALLTMAPTGTVSMMSKVGAFPRHNTSSGLEPVWRLIYKRRRKVNPEDKDFRADFIDETGDIWMEFEVLHNNLQNWRESHDMETIPAYFVTSEQIDWRYRVKLQGTIQRYIDHAISSTINLPKGTSPEVVSSIYREAWRSGLKGVTVYVDGSRSGVLIENSDNRPQTIKRAEAPRRPNILPCELHRLTYKGKPWLAAVGMLGDEPYEMFATEDSGDVSKPEKTGRLIKKARGRYALETEGGSIHNIAVPEFGWATRLISTSLRHGVPIDFIVEQLNKEGGVADINRVLARVLKKYVKNGKVRSSVSCQSCNSTNLIWEEGCMKCADCGHSKCG